MQVIPLSALPYEKLKKDFAVASHLAPIDQLDLKGAGGVFVKCHYIEDGLLAASYLFKKFEAETTGAHDLSEEEFIDDDFPMEHDDEEEDEDEGDMIESLLRKNNKFIQLPVIPAHEFASGFAELPPHPIDMGPLSTRWAGEVKTREPYWMKGDFPLIVEDANGFHLHSKRPFEHFEQTRRLLIYISMVRREPQHHFFSAGNVDHFEKTLLFETKMEYCALEKPPTQYYEQVLQDLTKAKGYRISKTIDKAKLIQDLMEYRGAGFRSTLDLDTFVNKAVNKKRNTSKTLTKTDFEQLFLIKEIRKKTILSGKSLQAAKELDKLIGLGEVKAQLRRLVKRMKFDFQRRNNGYATLDTHASAVFMGNPGTAKTTVARIFGKMLCEENVLACDTFMEVARKDLVGKFVGWTAPTVAGIFEEAKGGVIFIDEAYSLASEGNADGYSEEALAEIIRQMENNPDTLVIFAGYSDKMKNFIRNANPGLRSRLTNVIEFKDYGTEEMCEIFAYFLNKEGYILEDLAAADETIRGFLDKAKSIRSEHLGNGRFVRKLFKTAVGYMAEREDNDLQTLRASDIEKAAEEIIHVEMSVSDAAQMNKRIGFHG